MLKNNELRNKILSLYKEDQDDIKRFKNGSLSIEKLREHASARTKSIEVILLSVTDKDLISAKKNVFDGFFALIQHSGNHKLIDYFSSILMKNLSSLDKNKKESIPYLIDRSLVLQDKKQRYGTQFGPDGEKLPIEDTLLN